MRNVTDPDIMKHKHRSSSTSSSTHHHHHHHRQHAVSHRPAHLNGAINNPPTDTHFLEQLTTLRNFLSGCGLEAASSEKTMSSCLRQCGYNIERAAEMIIMTVNVDLPGRPYSSCTAGNRGHEAIDLTADDDDDECPNTKVTKPPPTHAFRRKLLRLFQSDLLPTTRAKTGTVSHPNLTYLQNVAESLEKSIETQSTVYQEECPICLDRPEFKSSVMVLTPCAHAFCRDCLVEALTAVVPKKKKRKKARHLKEEKWRTCPDGPCPVCHEFVRAEKIIAVSGMGHGNCVSCYYLMDS